MKTVRILLLTSLVLVAPCGTQAEDKKKPAGIMQRKLIEAQKVLEGVAMNDYESIAKHSQELIEISKLAAFKAFPTPQYETLSLEFRKTAAELADNAKKKNGDAAALSYVAMTLSCVKCHKYVREVRMARLDETPRPLAGR